MSTINLDRECGCFRRSNLENNTSFESKDDALMQAQAMVNHMNTKFCSKHGFTLSEDGENFSITMGQPVRQAAPSGGCCGGGHCD
ncbi:MAG: Unknown protein [uncultured Sulfurovum sp.]|uniref:Uncharacterized protein n=1 Tax=uncultured Sulfurovum sp. TaxID=269237 RepID=A0A6S6T489_9BACT|nr:MAG: Unknown protein [uncultured Sulfurovum sp.]